MERSLCCALCGIEHCLSTLSYDSSLLQSLILDQNGTSWPHGLAVSTQNSKTCPIDTSEDLPKTNVPSSPHVPVFQRHPHCCMCECRGSW
jgi:hypothetical protein